MKFLAAFLLFVLAYLHISEGLPLIRAHQNNGGGGHEIHGTDPESEESGEPAQTLPAAFDFSEIPVSNVRAVEIGDNFNDLGPDDSEDQVQVDPVTDPEDSQAISYPEETDQESLNERPQSPGETAEVDQSETQPQQEIEADNESVNGRPQTEGESEQEILYPDGDESPPAVTQPESGTEEINEPEGQELVSNGKPQSQPQSESQAESEIESEADNEIEIDNQGEQEVEEVEEEDEKPSDDEGIARKAKKV